MGFSGGVDSVVLSQVLVRDGIRPYLLHVNYGLRPEADEDEQWCRWYAQEYRFELRVLRANPEDRTATNVQNWARELRYRWFQEMAATLGAKTVYTAHHMDDRRETFLMNALRGAGLSGILGMSNTAVERPLAHWDKAKILDFAVQHDLPWREDGSNNTLKYTRNKVRLLLPEVLDQVEPRWRGGLSKTVDNLERDRLLLHGFLERWMEEHCTVIEGEHHIHFGPWMERADAQVLLWRVLIEIDKQFNYEEVGHVLRGTIGQRTSTRRHLLIKDRTAFICGPQRPRDPKTYQIERWEDLSSLPFELTFESVPRAEVVFDHRHEWVSPRVVQPPFLVRCWTHGDRFQPFGMRGQKKVADFLNDLRVPTHHKERTYVLEKDGTILWVLGYRIAQQAALGTDENVAYLTTFKQPYS